MKTLITCLVLFMLLAAGRCGKVVIEEHTVCDSTVLIPVYYDSLLIRDSVVISDTVRLVEYGDHDLYIYGNGAMQHATFYIDLDSIRVTIENGKIIDAWQRPARTE